MAALNQAETEALRNVRRLLWHVEKNGYDPKKDTHLKKAFKDADSLLNMVVQMKGYYPK